MKTKITMLALAAIVSVSTATVARADSNERGGRAGADIEVETSADHRMMATTSASSAVRGNATSSMMRGDRDSDNEDRGNATSGAMRNEHASGTPESHGKMMSEAHRSAVASFVHSLLAVADREGGIGAQVRVVAQSQNDSASTSVAAMAKVEGRGSFHTFFFGSDYRNLSIISREIATTTANIAELKGLLSKAASDADRAELSVQIKALEDEQARLQAYVKAHEGKFSLFGWFTRMF